MRFVLLSDTHGMHDQVVLPAGDVLIHAGDLSNVGAVPELLRFMEWFAAQPHRHKLFIAGNHDWSFQRQAHFMEAMVPSAVRYLHNSAAVCDGVRVWGTPYVPEFNNWAFNVPRGPALARIWSYIPDDTQVLVTHTPPYGILDIVDGFSVGCKDLRARVEDMPALRLHVFGDIHLSAGRHDHGGTTFVNAAVCDEDYNPTQPVRVFDWAA